MESLDSFQLLPVTIDPATKALSSSSSSLAAHIETINATHRNLLTLDTPNQAPGPPLPVKPQRSQQITKLKESANASLKKSSGTSSGTEVPQNIQEAIKLYTIALDMALARPPWEPAGLVREETATMYSNRAQAHMNARQYADAWMDAKLSVECKKAGNSKAWWRGGRVLVEMGKRDEAIEWVRGGLEGEEQALIGARGQNEQLKAQIQQAQRQGAQVPPQALQQVKTVEDAVKAQEDGVKELKDFIKDLEG